MMKYYFASLLSVILSVSGLSAQQSEPILMKINGKGISLSEFEYIYNKNNSNNVIDKKSLDEYINLFIGFKLKVEEALAQGLDTTQTFKSEYEMYRKQLAEQYMTHEKKAKELLAEAYERKKEEREVAHILIRIPEGGTATDTLNAFNKAMTYYERAQKEDFEQLAREVSDDPSVAQNGGYVGWISSFRTPYAFETAVYNTPIGNVSKPVRTFWGYHLIQVKEKRLSPGEIKVAHILLTTDRQDSTQHTTVKQRIDSIHQLIKAGEDFGQLAVKFSQDPGSSSQQGELPWFGSGRMIPEFEKASFALSNNGDVSEPIRSAFGWHIIRRIDKKPLPKFDEYEAQLTNEMKQTDRQQLINETYIEGLKAEYGFHLHPEALKAYYTIIDQYQPGDSAFNVAVEKLNAPLARFADQTLTQSQLNQLIINTYGYRGGVRADFITETYKRFVAEKIREYELTQLNRKYPDYRNLINEYHDGILLFEVMNREVWDKASKDTEGLSRFFKKNKKKYKWDKLHYKGRIIYAKDNITLKAAQSIIKRAEKDSVEKYLYQRLNDSIKYVKTEKGLWSIGENKLIDAKIFKTGQYTPDEAYPYIFVTGKKLRKPEEYSDVKGTVTADYQDYLEKNWLAYLRQKYPVEVDEKVLKTVKKN